MRGIAITYINVFRAIPALLVLVLMAGSFPFLPVPVIKDLTTFQIAFLGLGIGLRGLHRGGLPRRHRVGGPGPDRGGAQPRHEQQPDDAA